MTVVTSTKFELADGAVHGPYRNVMNPNIHAGEGSIHDQATAEKLGFRGGTVAGSNHMDLFPPLGRLHPRELFLQLQQAAGHGDRDKRDGQDGAEPVVHVAVEHVEAHGRR